jgi:hypothetical protein
MTGKSIKEIMDERFGVNQIPRRQVSRAEMDEIIKEAKERGKTKKKLAGNEKKEEARENEKGGMDNFPCPRCKEIKWMKLTDGTGRYYCLKCGEVIQYTDIESAKEILDQNETPAPVSQCDEAEKNFDQINPLNEQITETDKELLYCEYRCNDCQQIVVACGNSLEKAKNLVAFHKGCSGKLIFVRQVNLKIAGNKERFSHPRVERAICNGCSDDMGGCPRTFERMVSCLLNNMDYKMKWLRGG